MDRTLDVVALRDFDGTLVGRGTPDWYLYLRADEGGFDALVTRDWHQSGQAEEMWTLTKTRLSVVTWQAPVRDPVAEWGQLLAYLPEIRRVLELHGPSIVFLPRPLLNKQQLRKASEALASIADDEGRSKGEVLRNAERSIRAWLHEQGLDDRFQARLG